ALIFGLRLMHTDFKSSFKRFFLCLSIGIIGTGCASARMSDVESDNLFRQGRYEEAAIRLQKGAVDQGDNGRDLLLFLLDAGLSLHSAGKFEESNKAFQQADKIADIKDYTSLAAETATLLTSDNLKDYKGEDFEKVLINTYLAMNYALMGDNENAMVEARRVNRKLYLMVSEGGKKYKQNAFARYLSAILYEEENNYNDAYIDYKNTWKLRPDFPGLGLDLWRCAWQLRMPDEMERWDSVFHLSREDHDTAKLGGPKSRKGEIVVLYENGISPIKRPNPNFSELPKFYPRYNPVTSAQVELNGEIKGTTAILENIERTAIENLDEKYGGMIAKKIAGLAAKEGVAYGISKTTDSPLLGFLAKVAMYASDQADLRSWSLLPRDLQLFRISVDPGTYAIRAIPSGTTPLPTKTIQIEAGKKVFVNFRYIP
ncbi:MAG: hypothetical protein ABI041_14955, partial [Bdellovibrionia bacterium]